MVDIVKREPPTKDTKHSNYILNEDKALLKMKSNLERGGVKVEDTPKKGAKIVTMNPGEFLEVMGTIVNLKKGQKFTIGNVNIHVTENCETEDKVHKKTVHKLVLRLTRRTFPTATTSPTVHVYPTDQKFMIQGSMAAMDMCEKEFFIPLIKKVLAGKEAKVNETNEAVAQTKTHSKKRKGATRNCNYCENSYTSITAMKKHMLEVHIVALETARQSSGVIATHNISPSTSPPAKKEKPSTKENDLKDDDQVYNKKLIGCEMCGKFARGRLELEVHMKAHLNWKSNVVKTPMPGRRDDDDEDLMANDAGIEELNLFQGENIAETSGSPLLQESRRRPTTLEGRVRVTAGGGQQEEERLLVEERQEEGGLQLVPGSGPEEDGRLLRILSTITPWYRIPHKQQDEGRGLATPKGDLQEEVRVVTTLAVEPKELKEEDKGVTAQGGNCT